MTNLASDHAKYWNASETRSQQNFPLWDGCEGGCSLKRAGTFPQLRTVSALAGEPPLRAQPHYLSGSVETGREKQEKRLQESFALR